MNSSQSAPSSRFGKLERREQAMSSLLRSNKLVNADVQGRLLGRYAPCAPLRGRGLHARYVAWSWRLAFDGVGPERTNDARHRVWPALDHRWRATSSRVGTSLRGGLRSPRLHSMKVPRVMGLVAHARNGFAALPNTTNIGAMPPQLLPHLVLATSATHNKAVETDAQGRPRTRSASCAPIHGRRSPLR
jgi:hypothetical protein